MEHKIYFYSNRKITLIDEMDIAFLQADGSYCRIKLINGIEYRISRNMNYIYNQINYKENFEIVHRSFCVNLKLIQDIYKDANRNMHWSILLSTGDIMPASSLFIRNFKKAIKDRNNPKNTK